jgi:hypothetical protein
LAIPLMSLRAAVWAQPKSELVGMTTMSRTQMRCGSFQQDKMISADSSAPMKSGWPEPLAVLLEADSHLGMDVGL